ncbi:PREDICTED: rRNA-processing protein UTP23 homolog [Priapulus caudatus]|uniref:rRNA-processing protein UTP23 homolog n=1 Tax=Priapulus caudatus TaxID=37621 RepID=A0ABM1ET74_PRICU|nr:PREDICTED: rRNA-processing protein UTP23 homolog [Priapulus caudatus]
MKLKRQKHAKRILSFYKTHFNIQAPFQVLLDGTFSQAALRGKININEQLPKYIGPGVKLATTSCVLQELESIGKAVYGALVILKQFPVLPCGHKDRKQPLSANKCLQKMLGKDNPHKYFIATQDRTLTEHAASLPGTPLLFIYMNTVVLDKPSKHCHQVADELARGSVAPAEEQKGTILQLKRSAGLEEPQSKLIRRKKIKGPNPLSCKKSKKVDQKSTHVRKEGRNRHKRNKNKNMGTS